MYSKSKWRYEKATQTIRTVPENYWVASMNSFEGMMDHEANGEAIARHHNIIIRKGDDSLAACGELIHGDGTSASLQRTIDLARKALGIK